MREGEEEGRGMTWALVGGSLIDGIFLDEQTVALAVSAVTDRKNLTEKSDEGGYNLNCTRDWERDDFGCFPAYVNTRHNHSAGP